MTDQLTLDAMWRATDPDESRDAALEVDTNAREREVLLALRLLIAAADCHDIQAVLADRGMVRDRNCIGRRITSLRRKGLVRHVGSKVGAAGKPNATWSLTELGREAAG